MGFYQKQPVNPKKTTVTYIWTGLNTPGVFIINAQGDAQKFSYGFDLVRDPHFVGGLKIDVMGWTGPLTNGATHYQVEGSFPGAYLEKIALSGSNGDFVIAVTEIPSEAADEYIKTKVA